MAHAGFPLNSRIPLLASVPHLAEGSKCHNKCQCPGDIQVHKPSTFLHVVATGTSAPHPESFLANNVLP